jgi:hypothetical protein
LFANKNNKYSSSVFWAASPVFSYQHLLHPPLPIQRNLPVWMLLWQRFLKNFDSCANLNLVIQNPSRNNKSRKKYFIPGIEIEFNVVKFMRIGLGGYYRYTSGLNLEKTGEHIMDGFSAGLSLKFGKF